MEHIKRPHPLGVTLREVVIDRDHMNAFAGEGIKEHRQGGHKGFTLTGSHLGNLPLMKGDTSDELHVIMNHIPLDLVATGFPAVGVDGFLAFDAHEVVIHTDVAVELSCLHYQFRVLLETAGSGFYDGEGLGKDAVKTFLDSLILLLDEPVGLLREFLLFTDGDVLIEGVEYLGDPLLKGILYLTKLLLKCSAALPLCIVAQGVNLRIHGQYLIQYGLYLLIVPFGLGAEQLSDYRCE